MTEQPKHPTIPVEMTMDAQDLHDRLTAFMGAVERFCEDLVRIGVACGHPDHARRDSGDLSYCEKCGRILDAPTDNLR